jgi:DNA-binding cell septation regulator SpoVG
MTKPKITIRRLKNCDNLLAYADVTLRVKFGEITIRRFKILEGDQKPWVAFPQVQYYHLLSVKYVGLLKMNKRVEDYLSNQILKAYRNAVRNTSAKKS